eukprot:jgi/Orpsp1_1/1187292/evm.model.d7180000056666.1
MLFQKSMKVGGKEKWLMVVDVQVFSHRIILLKLLHKLKQVHLYHRQLLQILIIILLMKLLIH